MLLQLLQRQGCGTQSGRIVACLFDVLSKLYLDRNIIEGVLTPEKEITIQFVRI